VRLLVTRPAEEAERTAARLRALGHEVIVGALLTIEPIIDADLGAGPWVGAVITSANAARAIAAHPRREEVIALPAFVVGAQTADAARQAGFSDVTSADGNARDLARLLAQRFAGAGQPLLYLAGVDRAVDLAAELAGQVAVRTVEVYRAVAIGAFPAPVQQALLAGTIDGVLHYSRRSADIYLNLAIAAGLLDSALAPIQYCLSPQIAQPLLAAGARKVRVASRPDEIALLDLINSA
jgi:uroporphyrinogen-III synthase